MKVTGEASSYPPRPETLAAHGVSQVTGSNLRPECRIQRRKPASHGNLRMDMASYLEV